MRNGPLLMAILGLTGLILLAGCASNPRAPVLDLSVGQTPTQVSEQAPASAQLRSLPGRNPSSQTYVVKPGDTLYSIARANDVQVDALMRWNDITDPTQLPVGQALKFNVATATTTTPAPVPSKPVPATPKPNQAAVQTRPAVATPTPGRVQTAPTPPASPVKRDPPAARVADTKLIQWGWPASGRVIQSFSAASKGIDIAGALGDPVRAAADGKVMYSGNGVRGLGNLIIINHQNGFITAYAHNRALLVKAGQEVKRGAKIAEIGQTDTTSPRLHFEVRRQGTPINPLQYLPKR